jgi:hypothetical protein
VLRRGSSGKKKAVWPRQTFCRLVVACQLAAESEILSFAPEQRLMLTAGICIKPLFQKFLIIQSEGITEIFALKRQFCFKKEGLLLVWESTKKDSRGIGPSAGQIL